MQGSTILVLGLLLTLSLPLSSPCQDAAHSDEVRIKHGPQASAFGGTLVLPARPGPHPAVLLVPPAGEHPRDELRRGGAHLRDLAKRLAEYGIASLRVDNRGVGTSKNDAWPQWDWSVSIEQLTKDVAGHFAWLRKQPGIDIHRVGILAHGDAVVPAARFAAEMVPRTKRPAFVVLLSPSSRRATEDLARRMSARVPEDWPPEKRGRLETQLSGALEKIAETGASKDAIEGVEACFTMLGMPEPEARASAFAENYSQQWYRDYFSYRPRAVLRAIRGPVLAVLARDDDRVAAPKSAKAIDGAFRSAMNFNARVTLLEAGGHFLEPGNGRKVLHEGVVRAIRRFVSDATGFLRVADIPGGVRASKLLAITGVSLVDVERGHVLTGRTVIVRAGSIVEVVAEDADLPEGARVIAGRGRFLMPGMWDCHGHLSMWGPDAFVRLVARGVTSVRDMGGDLRELSAMRKRIASGEVLGPRLWIAGPFLDGDKPNDVYRRFLLKPAQVAPAVTELRAAGIDFLKVHSFLPPEVFAELARIAKEKKIPFAGHVPVGLTPLQASDAGITSIEHADTFFSALARAKDTPASNWPTARAWWKGEDGVTALRRIAKNGTVVVPTLAIVANVEDRMGGMFKTIAPWTRDMTRALHEAGVSLATGTDFARRIIGNEPGASLQRELELLVASGLGPVDALRAATTTPAQRFGGRTSGGRIVAGEPADLLLLRENPLDDVRNVRSIEGVVLRGAWLPRARLHALLEWARKARAR